MPLNNDEMAPSVSIKKGAISRRDKIIIFCCIAVLWILFDQFTKLYFDSIGNESIEFISGILNFSLVYNKGGAWGMFSDMTVVLAIFSLIVCAAVLVYVFAFAKDLPLVGYIGLALVFAGGIGNSIDRFIHGYVIDFLATQFIDFPVFNIADIGVTCGIVLFVFTLLFSPVAFGDAGREAVLEF